MLLMTSSIHDSGNAATAHPALSKAGPDIRYQMVTCCLACLECWRSLAVVGQLAGMRAEQGCDLGLERLRQQRSRAVAQHLGQRVGKSSWLRELETAPASSVMN